MLVIKQGDSRKMDLGVKHDGAENAGILHSSPEIVQGPLMILMAAMREIEASNIHPSPQQLLYHGYRP